MERRTALLILWVLTFTACAVRDGPTPGREESGVTTVSLPDLIPTSLSYDAATGIFTSVVLNQGGAPTPSGIVIGNGFYVDGNDVTWGSIPGPLAPGASVTIDSSSGGAYTISPGTHTIMVWADNYGCCGRFPEGSLGDKTLSETLSIDAPLPDVVPTSLSYNPATGIFTSVVKNQGAAPTPTGVVIGNGFYVDGDDVTWGSVPGPLAPGASVTIDSSGGGAYAISPGTHTIMVWADNYGCCGRFPEASLNDKTLSKTITVGGTTATGCPGILSLTNNASWPSSCQFAVNGPWHQKIPTNHPYDPNDAAVVAGLLQVGDQPGAGGTMFINQILVPNNSSTMRGEGYPNYVCQSGDTSCVQVQIDCRGGTGWCDGFKNTGSIQGDTLYVPKFGIPEENGVVGNDHHMSVLDCATAPSHCLEWNFYSDYHSSPPADYALPPGGYATGAHLVVDAADYTDPIKGDGWSTAVGGTVTVSGATMLPALVRSSEVMDGIFGIQHALSLAVSCGTGNTGPSINGDSYDCGNLGYPMDPGAPAGARFYWDEPCTGAGSIDSRPIDPYSKALLCALHTYGGYVTDTNGSYAAFQVDDVEMTFGGVTGYTDYVTPFIQNYGTEYPMTWYGGTFGDWWTASIGHSFSGRTSPLSAQDFQTHMHMLDRCVDGNAGSQGTCP